MPSRLIKVTVVGDARNVRQAFAQTDQASKGLGASFDALGGKLKAALGVSALVAFGKAVVGAAVDAEESAAAFDTTFGPAAARAGAFVDELANKAGMAGYQLQQLMAVTGNVVQGLGATEAESEALSERMVTLAADVASFSNAEGGAQAVLLALQSSINGEREALKTYGLAISEAEVQAKALEMSHKTSAEELTRLDKALATVEVAYGKANKAVGDLDRTQDSHANTLRAVQAAVEETKVALGQALLPVLDALLPVVKELGPAVANVLTPAFQALGLAVQVLSPALQAAATLLSALPGPAVLAAGAVIGLAVHFKTFSNLLDTMKLRAWYAGDAIGKLSVGLAAAGAAAVAGVAIYTALNNAKKEAAALAAAWAATLDTETGAITDNTRATLLQALTVSGLLPELTAAGVTVDLLALSLGGSAEATRTLNARLAAAGGPSHGLRIALDALNVAAATTAEQQAATAESAALAAAQEEGFLGVVGAVTRAIDELTGKRDADAVAAGVNAAQVDLLAASEEGLIGYTQGAGQAAATWALQQATARDRAGELAARTDAAAAAMRNLHSAMLENVNPVVAAAASVDRLAEAETARAAAEKKAADASTAAATAAARGWRNAPELAEEAATAAAELADAQLAVAVATLEAQANLDALRYDPAALQRAIAAIATALGISDEEARALLESLGLLDGKVVHTVIDVSTTGHGRWVYNPTKDAMEWVPEAAEGAHVRRSGLALIHAGETVVPAGVSPASIEPLRTSPATPVGGSLEIHVHVDLDGREIARAVVDPMADELDRRRRSRS